MDRRVELTIRGLILGVLITVLFTAANVYLGLKIGLTFASSIPAAVISMAVLRAVKNSTIWENNIVQTVASSAGTLSSIIFVLPGLIMVGWWTGFPFWTSFAICAIGGTLGVMYSIPLRRALVTDSPLPYPEGVAGAEVLKVGSRSEQTAEAAGEGRIGFLTVLVGSLVAAALTVVTATRVLAGEVTKFFKVGAGVGAAGTSFSLALLGAGHLMGISVGLAQVLGLIIAWGIAVPCFTAHAPDAAAAFASGDLATFASTVWRKQVRLMGAGTIGVAAIWTLAKMIGPVLGGLASALAAQRVRIEGNAESLPITERDIPIGIVAMVSMLALAPLAWLLWTFLEQGGVSAAGAVPLIIGGLAYIVVSGFFVAAICGYMAGLIGSSNSPLSGVGILAIIGASLLLLMAREMVGADKSQMLVAFALFVTAVVFAVATIANDNLQDLKTGQLVGATPWKQQAALVVGVLAGAAIIPPILEILNTSNGFVGGPPSVTGETLPAPQATLISTLAKGVLGGDLNWGLIGTGALIGVGLIILDEIMGRLKLVRLPPLGAGIGIYLPMTTVAGTVIGSIVGWVYEHVLAKGPHADAMKRLGVLLASGLIVGEGIMGVLIAGIVFLTKKEAPLALVGEGFAATSELLGIAVFAAIVIALYAWITSIGRKAGEAKA